MISSTASRTGTRDPRESGRAAREKRARQLKCLRRPGRALDPYRPQAFFRRALTVRTTAELRQFSRPLGSSLFLLRLAVALAAFSSVVPSRHARLAPRVPRALPQFFRRASRAASVFTPRLGAPRFRLSVFTFSFRFFFCFLLRFPSTGKESFVFEIVPGSSSMRWL